MSEARELLTPAFGLRILAIPHPKVINSTVRDALHVLDGLLGHEADLRIKEHYTDTAGFTDQVFGTCHMLGFRFAPRIRDLGDHKIYPIAKPAKYPSLQPLICGTVNTKRIEQYWDDFSASSARSGWGRSQLPQDQ